MPIKWKKLENNLTGYPSLSFSVLARCPPILDQDSFKSYQTKFSCEIKVKIRVRFKVETIEILGKVPPLDIIVSPLPDGHLFCPETGWGGRRKKFWACDSVFFGPQLLLAIVILILMSVHPDILH